MQSNALSPRKHFKQNILYTRAEHDKNIILIGQNFDFHFQL